jgi:hypothetical protein
MPGAQFWLLHVGLMAIPIVVFFAVRFLPFRALHESYQTQVAH